MSIYFISHASEDKQSFVRSLADKMMISGAAVFYDEYSIKLGDSIFESINKGIQEADFGIIVLSPSFLNKDWTNKELNSIFTKHVSGKCTLIPVFLDITPEEVSFRYPLISDILGIDAKAGVPNVSDQLLKAGGITPKPQYISVDFSKKPNYEKQTSWTIILGNLFLQKQTNPEVTKVLYDLGVPHVFKDRVTISIIRNELIEYKITDNTYRSICLSGRLDKLSKKGGTICVQYNKIDNLMRLVLEREIVNQIQTSPLNLPESFLIESTLTIGCSLETEYPSSFHIGNHGYISSFLTIDQISGYINDNNKTNVNCLKVN